LRFRLKLQAHGVGDGILVSPFVFRKFGEILGEISYQSVGISVVVDF
jgi:hypothetical protein